MAKVETRLDFQLVDNVTRGLSRIGKGVDGLGASLTKINQAAELAGKAIRAIDTVTGFSTAIQSARDFESAMAQVQAVTGASVEELRKLEQAAEDASANSVFSATEAANGLAELARAGLEANDAIAVLNPTLQIAQGQNISVAQSAELLTTTLTQFGLAADQAGRVADVLATSADGTATSVEQLGNALGYTAPLARQLGLSVEQTTAVLGALANAGFRGERAGTALRNVFSALLDPSSKFATALRQAGIESTDLATVFEKLSQRADKGKSVILALDAEARPAILALAQQGGDALRKLQTDLETAAGAAERTAGIYGDTFDGAAAKFANAIDRMRREVAAPILNAITDDVERLAAKLQEFAKSPAFQEITQQIAAFADQAATKIVEFIEGFDFNEALVKVQQFASDSKEVFDAIAASAGVVADAIIGLRDVYRTLVASTTELFVQTDELVRGLAESDPRIRAVAAAYQQLEEAQRRAAKTATDSAVAQEQVVESIAGASAFIQAAIESYNRIRAALEGLRLETVQVTPTLKDYERALQEAIAAGDSAEVAVLTKRIDELKQQIAGAGQEALTAAQRLSELKTSIENALKAGNTAEAQRLAGEYRTLSEETEKLDASVEKLIGTQGAAAKSMDQLGDSTAGAAKDVAAGAQQIDQAASKVDDTFAAGASAAAAIAQQIQRLRAEFSSSAGAAELFETRLANVNRQLLGSGLSTSIGQYETALNKAAEATRRNIAAQAQLADQIEQGLGMAALQGDIDGTIARLQGLEAETRNSQGQFKLLSQQRLDKLRSEIRATTAELLKQKQATEQLIDLTQQLQDEADRRAGRDDAVAERDFQRQLQRIQELERQGGASSRRAADEARRLARENHEAELREIQERARADQRATRENAAIERQEVEATSNARIAAREREAGAGSFERGGQGGQDSRASSGGVQGPGGSVTYNINITAPTTRELSEEIARNVRRGLDDARRRGL